MFCLLKKGKERRSNIQYNNNNKKQNKNKNQNQNQMKNHKEKQTEKRKRQKRKTKQNTDKTINFHLTCKNFCQYLKIRNATMYVRIIYISLAWYFIIFHKTLLWHRMHIQCMSLVYTWIFRANKPILNANKPILNDGHNIVDGMTLSVV